MLERLDWLHVSDLHFVAGGADEFSQKVACQALLDDAENRYKGKDPPSFVLVTGDVAFSGHPAEYERAQEFLTRFAAVLRLPLTEFFFVPGNHDVDRDRQRLTYRGACGELTSQPDVDRLLAREEDVAQLLERQAAYLDFVRATTDGQVRIPTEEGLAYIAPLNIDGLRVTLLGLNSSWLSGEDAEEMRLIIGERQVINAVTLAQGTNPRLQIAMAHHPIEWLREWDQLSCRGRLLAEVDFFHRGHLHVDEVTLSSSPERPCLSVAAGSGHATRFYANSYSRIRLELGSGRCVIESFRYDARAGGYSPGLQEEAQVTLRGSLPGSRADLVDALAACADGAGPYADYLASLIGEEKAEIPIVLDDQVVFRTPRFAQAAGLGDIGAAVEFLGLRNLLRLYDEGIGLSERLGEQAETVARFVDYLEKASESDAECSARIQGRRIDAPASPSGIADRPHSVRFLSDLRKTGDWGALEVQARRFLDNPDNSLTRAARRALAEALMHSDQGEKRAEARLIADDLSQEVDATAEDFLLASGCSEVDGDLARAVELTRQALGRWPDDPFVRDYSRGLASRAGDAQLRADLDEAGGTAS